MRRDLRSSASRLVGSERGLRSCSFRLSKSLISAVVCSPLFMYTRLGKDKSIPNFRTAPDRRTTTYERPALQWNHLRCRPGGSGFDVAEHGLLQLRIHFVCDRDYIEQDLAEIHSPQIVLKGVKDTDLQD